MHHAETVGDESAVSTDQLSKVLGQLLSLRVVLAGLARIESDVLQQQDVAVSQALGTRQRIGTDNIAGQLNVSAQLGGQLGGDRLQRVPRIRSTFRTAQMRGHDHLGAGVGECLEGRHRCVDATRVGDGTGGVERHIEVAAHQDAAARHTLGEQFGKTLDSHG